MAKVYVFHRTISVDSDDQPADKLDIPRQNLPKDEQGSGAKPVGGFLFTIKDSVENKGTAPVQLIPTAYIVRIGTPTLSGSSILFEGLIGRFSGSHVETASRIWSRQAGRPSQFNQLARASPTNTGPMR